jgi:hypothetical protein
MTVISDDAIDGLKTDFGAEIERSWRNAGKNHDWNVCFLVVLLIIGILIVVCSSAALSMIVTDSEEYWSLASAILGGASTVLAAFAFNQFNFEKRQRLWLDRLSALKVVRDRILIGERDARLFDDLAIVRSWHDFTPPADETLHRLLVSQREGALDGSDGSPEGEADAALAGEPNDDTTETRSTRDEGEAASSAVQIGSPAPEVLRPFS